MNTAKAVLPVRNSADSHIANEESFEDDIVLGVLDVIERDSAVTQRSVAHELGIALGLANAYLNRCVRKGLIKVTEAPARRYAYYLTPKGFAEKSRLTASYLAYSFSFFRKARAQCETIFGRALASDHRRLALIGPGDLAEIARLVAGNHSAQITGIVPAIHDAKRLLSTVRAFGEFDATIVTALEKPSEVYMAACDAFGTERVYVPELLRVRASARADRGDLWMSR